jgi:hypothetical protein
LWHYCRDVSSLVRPSPTQGDRFARLSYDDPHAGRVIEPRQSHLRNLFAVRAANEASTRYSNLNNRLPTQQSIQSRTSESIDTMDFD